MTLTEGNREWCNYEKWFDGLLRKASTQALIRFSLWSLLGPELAANDAGVSTMRPEDLPIKEKKHPNPQISQTFTPRQSVRFTNHINVPAIPHVHAKIPD